MFQHCPIATDPSNNVLLGRIEGPVWYTIYHQLPVVIRGEQTTLSINQPMGKGHQWIQVSCAKLNAINAALRLRSRRTWLQTSDVSRQKCAESRPISLW